MLNWFIIAVTVLRLFLPPLLSDVSFSTAIDDRTGHLLRLTISRDQFYRLRASETDISPLFRAALLAYEDQHFYQHPGVNAPSLLRAFWDTYIKQGRRIGASTLTMQVARLKFHLQTNTIFGKLEQIYLALLLDMLYSKSELFATYLNLVPYGANIEGVAAASLIFFNKAPQELTFSEILALCVIPQNPNARVPGSPANNLAQAQARQRLLAILKRKFSQKELGQDLARSISLQAGLRSQLPYFAPHFVESILAQHPTGSIIRTTLDLGLQQLVERKTKGFIERNKRLGFNNASVLLVDSGPLNVVAELGSVDYFNDSIQGQVNGTYGLRSPGSALKPFIYALAIDQGLIHPETMLKDSPTRFGIFNPENFDLDFKGPISATDALIHSRNIPAITLGNQLHKPDLYEFLQQSGIHHLREKTYYGLALVLGGAEITMQELTQLYAVLGHGGERVSLKKILAVDGKPVRYDPVPLGPRLISREACWLTLAMLEKNPRPGMHFRSDWMQDDFPVYWKTGTSRAYRDAWCVGLFGQYILAIWIGNFEGQGNPAFKGREAAAPLFFEMADAIATRKDFMPGWVKHRFAHMPSVSSIQVCDVSGQLPGPECRLLKATDFIPGKSPIQHCSIHRRIYLDSKTGLRVTRPGPGVQSKIYECWPSDFLELFRAAGIPRRVPPPYLPGISLEQREDGVGLPPQITSPAQHVIYSVRKSPRETDTIPLTAVTDADAAELSWFANDLFLGRSKSGQVLFWEPGIGDFLIRVVDSQGRVATRKLVVRVQQEKVVE